MMGLIFKSSTILLITLCASRFLRNQSAATRHLILTMGLISSLVVPLLGSLLPEWHVSAPIHTTLKITPGTGASLSPLTAPPLRAAMPPPARISLLGIWAAGAGLAGFVLLIGAARIRWLTFHSTPLTGVHWTSISTGVARRLNLERRVRLLRNDRAVLGTWGIFWPRVLLPADVESWPDDRLRVVLTHEFAHIKRFDWPVQVLAELGRAVYWFNPLFWMVCRSVRSQSEHACDDEVLNAGIDGKDYAAHLLDLARMLNNSNRGWSPVLAMSQPLHLERRFIAMLNPTLNHRSLRGKAVFATSVAAIGVALPLAAMRTAEPLPVTVPAAAVVVRVPAPAAPKVAQPAARAAAAKPVAAKSSAVKAELAPVQTQNDGVLIGTVSDASGAVVPGVLLTVTNRQTELQVVASEAGQFAFRGLSAGAYVLTADLPGFTTARYGVQIQANQTSRQNVVLSIGRIAQTVVVSAPGQRKPAPFPGTPQRIRVGGNVSAPALISQVKPAYPLSAREAGLEGVVHLQGTISTDGSLIGLHATNYLDSELATAALEAARQWRYRPALLNNVPIDVPTEIDVEFQLAP